MKRLTDVWWCELHQIIHHGTVTDWTMEHRVYLHPVFADIKVDPWAARARVTDG